MTNEETVRVFFTAYTSHDVDKMLSLFAPDATYEYVPYGEQGKGKVHESAASVWSGFLDAFPQILHL